MQTTPRPAPKFADAPPRVLPPQTPFEEAALRRLREKKLVDPARIDRALRIQELLHAEGVRKPLHHLLWETGAVDDLTLRALMDDLENDECRMTSAECRPESEPGIRHSDFIDLHRFTPEEDRLLQLAFLREAPDRLMEIDAARSLRDRLRKEGYARTIADLLVDRGVVDLPTARWWINLALGREQERRRSDAPAEAGPVQFLSDAFGGMEPAAFRRRIPRPAGVALLTLILGSALAGALHVRYGPDPVDAPILADVRPVGVKRAKNQPSTVNRPPISDTSLPAPLSSSVEARRFLSLRRAADRLAAEGLGDEAERLLDRSAPEFDDPGLRAEAALDAFRCRVAVLWNELPGAGSGDGVRSGMQRFAGRSLLAEEADETVESLIDATPEGSPDFAPWK